MPWINNIRTLYLAFYSRDAYIRAAREWRGIGFGYLFTLILISSVCIGIWVHIWANAIILQVEKVILPQLPMLTIKDGRMTIDKELPYVITIAGSPAIRFDKTADQPADPAEFAPIIFGENEVAHFVRDQGKVKKWIYEKIWSLVLDPLGVARHIKFLKTWLGLIVAAILLPIHFAWVASQTLILGAIGRVYTATMNFYLSYSKLVRVSVVAVTPGVVLGTLLIVTNQFFQLWLGIYGIMAAVYLFYGVYSNKHADDHIFYDMPMDDGYPETTEFEC
ncbi:MAG: DUF1189 domain-containing protein [Candidatus Obscuribacterales bacterium]|nr:DUF1189 domain-containing protein [Candidatus Obscuribacterales bacterium]